MPFVPISVPPMFSARWRASNNLKQHSRNQAHKSSHYSSPSIRSATRRKWSANSPPIFHPRLIGLTGTAEQIADAADTFAVYYSRGEEGEAGGYLMNHSNVTYLFGPDGDPLTTLPTDQGAEAVAAELERWVR